MTFVSTDKSKKVLRKYTKLWDEIKNQIETIKGGKPIKYKKYFMGVEFKSNDNLTLDKILSIPSIIIVAGSVPQKENKYFPQVYLYECVYEFASKLQK